MSNLISRVHRKPIGKALVALLAVALMTCLSTPATATTYLDADTVLVDDFTVHKSPTSMVLFAVAPGTTASESDFDATGDHILGMTRDAMLEVTGPPPSALTDAQVFIDGDDTVNNPSVLSMNLVLDTTADLMLNYDVSNFFTGAETVHVEFYFYDDEQDGTPLEITAGLFQGGTEYNAPTAFFSTFVPVGNSEIVSIDLSGTDYTGLDFANPFELKFLFSSGDDFDWAITEITADIERDPPSTPEPSSFVLTLSGLVGLFWFSRHRRGSRNRRSN